MVETSINRPPTIQHVMCNNQCVIISIYTPIMEMIFSHAKRKMTLASWLSDNSHVRITSSLVFIFVLSLSFHKTYTRSHEQHKRVGEILTTLLNSNIIMPVYVIYSSCLFDSSDNKFTLNRS